MSRIIEYQPIETEGSSFLHFNLEQLENGSCWVRNTDLEYLVVLEIGIIQNDRQREIKQKVNKPANIRCSCRFSAGSCGFFGSMHSEAPSWELLNPEAP